MGSAYIWNKSTSYVHEEKAVEFIQENLNTIVSCETKKLIPILTAELQEELTDSVDQSCKIKYSDAGELLSFGKPEFINVKYPPSVKQGVAASHIEFKTVGHFENGDLLISLVLTEELDSFKIKSLHLSELSVSN